MVLVSIVGSFSKGCAKVPYGRYTLVTASQGSSIRNTYTGRQALEGLIVKMGEITDYTWNYTLTRVPNALLVTMPMY